MASLPKNSLITRFGITLGAISLMALISIIASVIMAESTKGDAAGINLAGSLRMQSYRVATLMERLPEAGASDQVLATNRHEILELQQRLESDVLRALIPTQHGNKLSDKYERIRRDWKEQLKPQLLDCLQADHLHTKNFLGEIEIFVGQINQMVLMLEKRTESKIRLLTMVQGICLFLTLIIIFVSLFDIHNNIVTPLRYLVEMANRARQRDFSARIAYQGENELGVLGETYNSMAEDLSKVYNQLESHVEQKTNELKQSNDALQLLYDTTRSLNHEARSCLQLSQIVHSLEQATEFEPILIKLCEPQSQKLCRTITSFSNERPVYCESQACTVCMTDKEIPTTDGKASFEIAIEEKECHFGSLVVNHDADKPASQFQLQLLRSVAEHIATALTLDLQAEHNQALSLMEERTVIARELHDSLAQSLSYLKIQVARLQRHYSDKASEQAINGVIVELREGLNDAYRQLRELLATFRLKLDSPGLEHALQTTVTEFSNRLSFRVGLDYRIDTLSLSPNEEIHVLQIVREALANIVKHAHASHASIQLEQDGQSVRVRIEDDGIGLPSNNEHTSHYGLIIMRDRAQSLNGKIEMTTQTGGGTLVALGFTPKTLASQN